jgi:hypothetical protein
MRKAYVVVCVRVVRFEGLTGFYVLPERGIQQIPPPSATLRARNDNKKETKLYTNVCILL